MVCPVTKHVHLKKQIGKRVHHLLNCALMCGLFCEDVVCDVDLNNDMWIDVMVKIRMVLLNQVSVGFVDFRP